MELMTRGKFDQLVDCIEDNYNYFINECYPDNVYNLSLADGKRVTYTIKPTNIPHLLGVKLDNLANKNIIKREPILDMLNNFIENKYSIYNSIRDNKISISEVFSDYVILKNQDFKEIIKRPFPNNIYFICEYDSTRNYIRKDIENYTADIYIAKKNDNGNIDILGLIKNSNHYDVQTNRVISSDNVDKEIYELISRQVITFATKLEITNNKNPLYNYGYHISFQDKDNILKNLIDLRGKYDANIDTSTSHKYDNYGYMKKEDNKKKIKEILNDVKNATIKGEVYVLSIEEEEILGDALIDFINSVNDQLCFKNYSDNNDKRYSELFTHNKELSDNVENLSKENSTLKDRISELESEKNKLIEERDIYKENTLVLDNVQQQLLLLGNNIKVKKLGK